MRTTTLLLDHWQFRKDTEEKWEPVTLPHTWNNLDGQDGGNDYYQGIGWYQRKLTVSDTEKKRFLRFDAVSKMAEVSVNGKPVGTHKGGFSAFTLDITDFLREGENEILVKADNSNSLAIYPRQADFTFFGGIYRNVSLIEFDSGVHFDPDCAGTDGVYLTPNAADKTLRVNAVVTGGQTVSVEVTDASHRMVAKKTGAVVGIQYTVTLDFPEIHLWNGVEDPYLYTAKITLLDGDRIADEKTVSFGFRLYHVDAEKGFFLNGDYYPLRGVCRHQDRENMGWAITEKEHLEDMSIIREIGANTIRLAHYQQAEFFYDLCDRNGLVVWAEIPFISVYDERSDADDNLRQQMRELVLQNYNHPSICFWGIANEIGIGGESQKMYDIVEELNSMTKEMDPTRLTVIANVGMTQPESPLFHITDVTSYNEYMGWYDGNPDDHGKFCDERHGKLAGIPLAISEYGADSNLQFHSAEPRRRDYTEEYQALIHEKAEAAFTERPFIYATWLWNMFDFAADNRDEGGCKGRNSKGLVTYDRKTKKQSFYYYKACWSKEPFVYVCGKRYTKRAGETVDIQVYSNQPEIELYVNGTFAGKAENAPVFRFPSVKLDRRINEILAKSKTGCTDVLLLEKVDREPESYVFRESKLHSGAVAQWFANLTVEKKELEIREGYLSVNDPMEEVFKYPEGFAAVQEIIAKPLAIDNPAMAARLNRGGGMSFKSIWNHINRMLPDEAIYILNERLNKIPKN